MRTLTTADDSHATLPNPLASLLASETTGTTAALRLVTALQTTLEVDGLMRLFSQHAGEEVPHDGYAYRHAYEGLESAWGIQAPYECNYELGMGGVSLGSFTLYRRRPFAEHETGLLDSLVWCLVYPLRNALSHHQLRQHALRDPLTGVRNRAALEEDLGHAVALARRARSPLSLVVLDIDHFKGINDRHGHAAGDEALKGVALCSANHLRAADSFYRYGGEEFVALLPDTDAVGARHLAERLRSAVAARGFPAHGLDLRLTVSIGIAELRPDERPGDLFRRADAALYRAKDGGRDRVAE